MSATGTLAWADAVAAALDVMRRAMRQPATEFAAARQVLAVEITRMRHGRAVTGATAPAADPIGLPPDLEPWELSDEFDDEGSAADQLPHPDRPQADGGERAQAAVAEQLERLARQQRQGGEDAPGGQCTDCWPAADRVARPATQLAQPEAGHQRQRQGVVVHVADRGSAAS